MKKILLSALLAFIMSTGLQASLYPDISPDDLAGIVGTKKFIFSTGEEGITLDLIWDNSNLDTAQVTAIEFFEAIGVGPENESDENDDEGYELVAYKLKTPQSLSWQEYGLIFVRNVGDYQKNHEYFPEQQWVTTSIICDFHQGIVASLKANNAGNPDHPVHSIAFDDSGDELDVCGLAISLEPDSSDDGDDDGMVDDL